MPDKPLTGHSDKLPGLVRAVFISFAVLLCLQPVVAQAGGLKVYPLRAFLFNNNRVEDIHVVNTGDKAILVQSEIFSWDMAANQDVLTPTRDLLVNPPTARLAPDQEQIFRVGLRRAADPDKTLSYRAFFREIPINKENEPGKLSFQVRFGIPVFLVSPSKPQHNVRWHAYRSPNGLLEVTAINTGRGPAPVKTWQIHQGETLISELVGGNWVLPENWRQWHQPVVTPYSNKEPLILRWFHNAGALGTQQLEISGTAYSADSQVQTTPPDPVN